MGMGIDTYIGEIFNLRVIFAVIQSRKIDIGVKKKFPDNDEELVKNSQIMTKIMN